MRIGSFWFCFAIISCILLGAPPATAQSAGDLDAIRKDVEALKKGQAEIQRNLQTLIRALQNRGSPARRQAPPPFKPTDISISGAAFKGTADARVTLVEFSDYQCPFCRRHFTRTMPELVKNYVETGKLKYVMKEFPLAQIHPKAQKASEAALCAGEHDKYWDLHDLIFANQRKVDPKDLVAHAETLGLDSTEFQACLDSGKYAKRVGADFQEGAKLGVRGTPTFFLGLTDQDDNSKFRAVKRIRGAQPYAAFQQAIDELLSGGSEKTVEKPS